jgi:hypothetical protein
LYKQFYPFTGKIDKKALEKIYFDRDVDGERIDITEYLESMWKVSFA